MKNNKKFGKKLLAGIMAVAITVQTLSMGALKKETAKAAEMGTAAKVVEIARTQLGYHEKASNASLDDFTANSGSRNYTKYHRDLGVTNGLAWCGFFVWWCMKNAGVQAGTYPASGSTNYMYSFFKNKGTLMSPKTYTPKPGDVIFFDNEWDGIPNHVGIVESVVNGSVTTIEGNRSDVVGRRYNAQNSKVMAYGSITFPDSANYVDPGTTATETPKATEAPKSNDNASLATSQTTVTAEPNPGAPYVKPTITCKTGLRNESVKWIQQGINVLMGTNLEVDGYYGAKTTAAVKNFQIAAGIYVDGVAGKQTINKINELWTKKNAGETIVLNPVPEEPQADTQNTSETAEVTATPVPTASLAVSGTTVEIKANPGDPYEVPSGSFRNGSTGDGVKWIQQSLNTVANAGLLVDGKFGAKTLAAVKSFQQANNLEVDGIVGKITIGKLNELYSNGTKVTTGTEAETTPVPTVVPDGAASAEDTNPGAPYDIPVGLYKKGYNGDAVKWIQTALNVVAGENLSVDGKYGPLTETAVKKFQKENNLLVDGAAGVVTISKLLENWKNKTE